jgi:hypothetical protein
VARFSDPEPLVTAHFVEGFDCGRASLNVWLSRYARQAAGSRSARTYVIVDDEQRRVVGYHALTAAGIERQAATRFRTVAQRPAAPHDPAQGHRGFTSSAWRHRAVELIETQQQPGA